MSIPVVDLQSHSAISDLIDAYSTVGFAYLVNHGIDQTLVDEVFAASAVFHALPREAKMAVELNEIHRGFIPINTSTDKNSSVAEVTKPNQSESFMMMREDAPGSRPTRHGAYLAGPNQWPEDLPGFRQALERYDDQMSLLGRRLVGLIGEGLGDHAGELAAAFQTPTTWLRLLHYPPQAPASDADLFGSAPHNDFGFLTLLAQDDVGGLQVQTVDGEWVDVPPKPGAFVMNVGDMLHRWSNGKLLSTPHRVINRSGRERYSCPFFFDPNVATVISPLASCCERGADFEAIVFGSFLRAELEAGYEAHDPTMGQS